MVSKWMALVLAVALMIPLMGCGRKNPPVQPPDSDYPRTYPKR